MSKPSEFFIYLIERYAVYKKTSADKVLAFWDELGLTDFIYDMYEIYHTERLQNAFDDIDSLIAERTKTNTQPV
jgi:hypothetical protein